MDMRLYILAGISPAAHGKASLLFSSSRKTFNTFFQNSEPRRGFHCTRQCCSDEIKLVSER